MSVTKIIMDQRDRKFAKKMARIGKGKPKSASAKRMDRPERLDVASRGYDKIMRFLGL